MTLYISIFTVVFSMFHALSAHAQDRVGLMKYMEQDIPAGVAVCEPGDEVGQTALCYVMNDFSRTLHPEDDTSGVMDAGGVSENQGAFLEVTVNQLATSVDPGEFETAQMFEFYIKLKWKQQSPGLLGFETSDDHLIKGQVAKSDGGQLEVQNLTIPDLYLILEDKSHFLSSYPLALAFGREAYDEAYELKHDVDLWMNILIAPVLNSYFQQGTPVEIQRP